DRRKLVGRGHRGRALRFHRRVLVRSAQSRAPPASLVHHLTPKRRKQMARKYGKKAQSKVKRAMHERKHGTLKSGRSGKRVKSRKQAIAIGLSEARKSGAKVPKKRGVKKK